MYLRNSAVRNEELRPLILEKGAEPLLRAAKAAHAKLCNDVGTAALRDLGCAPLERKAQIGPGGLV